MSEHAKPTPGPWEAVHNGHFWDILTQRDGLIGDVCASQYIYHDGEPVPRNKSEAIAAANARLIAEAGTVHHETGLTPRQLAEQRAELLEALEAISHMRDSNPSDAMADMPPLDYARHIMAEMRREARAAIAKAGGAA